MNSSLYKYERAKIKTFLKCIFYKEMYVKNNTCIGGGIVNKVQKGGNS